MTDIAMQADAGTGDTLKAFDRLRSELETCIIGQQTLLNICWWRCWLTDTCWWRVRRGWRRPRPSRNWRSALKVIFHRLQFTPDLLPGDLTGTEMYRPQTGEFEFQQGADFS